MTKGTGNGWNNTGADYSMMVIPLGEAESEEVKQSYVQAMNGMNFHVYHKIKMGKTHLAEKQEAEGRFELVNYDLRTISVPRTVILLANFDQNEKNLSLAAQEDLEKISNEIKACEKNQDYSTLAKWQDAKEVMGLVAKIAEGHDGQPENYVIDFLAKEEPELKKSIIGADNKIPASENIQFKTRFFPGL